MLWSCEIIIVELLVRNWATGNSTRSKASGDSGVDRRYGWRTSGKGCWIGKMWTTSGRVCVCSVLISITGNDGDHWQLSNFHLGNGGESLWQRRNGQSMLFDQNRFSITPRHLVQQTLRQSIKQNSAKLWIETSVIQNLGVSNADENADTNCMAEVEIA
jgi:hypothetical protein